MRDFLTKLLHGKITFSRTADAMIGYDRCCYGAWDYYVFYLVFFKVMVSK
jgi:hypothetical protein